jgi:hypothetical protein
MLEDIKIEILGMVRKEKMQEPPEKMEHMKELKNMQGMIGTKIIVSMIGLSNQISTIDPRSQTNMIDQKNQTIMIETRIMIDLKIHTEARITIGSPITTGLKNNLITIGLKNKTTGAKMITLDPKTTALLTELGTTLEEAATATPATTGTATTATIGHVSASLIEVGLTRSALPQPQNLYRRHPLTRVRNPMAQTPQIKIRMPVTLIIKLEKRSETSKLFHFWAMEHLVEHLSV